MGGGVFVTCFAVTAENSHRVPNPLKLFLYEDPSGYTKTLLPLKHYCREQLYEGPGSWGMTSSKSLRCISCHSGYKA